MSHTPGPWTVLNHAHPLIVRGEDARSSQSIAYGAAETTQLMQTGMSVEEVRANAHLIAAAPDMLSMLEAVIRHDEALKPEFRLSSSLIRHIQNTINKAKGL